VSYDYIVVGGGAAGAVVASRLSEDPRLRVLLIEAGPDYPDAVPGELLDASAPVTSGHNWNLRAIAGEDDSGSSESMGRVAKVFQRASGHLGTNPGAGPIARLPYPLGKVMGGGSAINGGLAFHARPEDYAAWAAAGNDEWDWERVRPCIERIAAMPMETVPPEGLSPFQEAFLETCLDRGHPRVDLRQGTASGVGLIPRNVDQGRRVSTASLYLAGARKRPNLTIQPRCLVDRLLVEIRNGLLTASGVEAIVDGQRHRFSGGRIVLSAGAVNSPAILLRSGIGAAGEVARAGGKPLLDLPGVGKNLMEHPAVSIWAVPKAGTCRAGEPVHQVMLQQRSALSGSLCDLQLFMLSGLPTERLPPLRNVVGADLAVGVSVVVATPRSRGRVELPDLDPARSPRIHLDCMKEASDLARMREGLRAAWSLLGAERLAAGVERLVLWSQSVVDSDPLLDRMIRSTLRGTWHPVGTLRMGPEGDGMAVVDQHGRLRGCSNVTVADASIMPAIPSVPTTLTCMLIGERIAAFLRGAGREKGVDDE
jgi:choline dehydrogenase